MAIIQQKHLDENLPTSCVVIIIGPLCSPFYQDYVPEMMHIARVVTRENPDDDEGGWPAEVAVALEPVLVENSCSCRLNNEPIISLGSLFSFPFTIIISNFYGFSFVFETEDDEDEDVVDSFLGGLLAATSQ